MVIELNQYVILYLISLLGTSLFYNYYFIKKLEVMKKLDQPSYVYYVCLVIAPFTLLLILIFIVIKSIKYIIGKLKNIL